MKTIIGFCEDSTFKLYVTENEDLKLEFIRFLAAYSDASTYLMFIIEDNKLDCYGMEVLDDQEIINRIISDAA